MSDVFIYSIFLITKGDLVAIFPHYTQGESRRRE